MKLSPIIATCLAVPATAQAPPTVFTTSGKINGISSAPNVFAYLKIPYAQPPVGSLRFKAPRPLLTPLTNRPASSSYGPACYERRPSFPGFPVNPHSEDCLNLHVYTAKKKSFKLKPVLVWIHGGSWNIGTSSQLGSDFTKFAEAHQDIVFVAINYRLNFFGYANSPVLGPQDSNAGIRDQRLAIEWIRNNIIGFGGDPNHIVLYGESAGAASVHAHLFAYPFNSLAKGVILSSGTVYFAGSNTQVTSRERYDGIAAAAGCTGTAAQIFACLQALPADELADAIPAGTGGAGTVPFVDNQLIFSYKEYQRRAKLGLFHRVPVLTGANDNEGDVFFFDAATNTVNYELADWFGMVTFQCFDSFAANTTRSAHTPVYRYRYSGLWPTISVPPVRVGHGMEVSIVFGRDSIYGVPQGNLERQATVVIQDIWATFTKNPAFGLKNKFNWPLYDPTKNTLGRIFEDNNLSSPLKFIAPLTGEEICQATLDGPDPGIPL